MDLIRNYDENYDTNSDKYSDKNSNKYSDKYSDKNLKIIKCPLKSKITVKTV